MRKGCPLVGIADITCDIGGSLEFVNRTTSIDSPFFRYTMSLILVGEFINFSVIYMLLLPWNVS